MQTPGFKVLDVASFIAGPTAADRGLSSAETAQRLARYCSNALVETERSLAVKLLGNFTEPFAYMIEAAAIISAVIGHWDDFAIISGLQGRACRRRRSCGHRRSRAAIGGKVRS